MPYQAPQDYTAAYTADDQKNIAAIIDWLNAGDKKIKSLAALAGLNSNTAANVLYGKYPSPSGKVISSLLRAIESQNLSQQSASTPFVEASVYKTISTAGILADRKRQAILIVIGEPGVGKTRSLIEWQKQNINSHYMFIRPRMSRNSLADELMRQFGLPSSACRLELKMSNIVDKVRGTKKILLVDEAASLSPDAMEQLRTLQIETGIGLVLVDDDQLLRKTITRGGYFDKLRSRCLTLPKIQTVPADDLAQMVTATLEPYGEVTPEIIKQCLNHSGGSARVLCEQLLDSVVLFGLNQGHALSPALIVKTASTMNIHAHNL